MKERLIEIFHALLPLLILMVAGIALIPGARALGEWIGTYAFTQF